MSGAFRLVRLFGFDVFIHWSWLIIFVLATWSLATGYLPDGWTAGQRWVVGAITSVLFFGSVLAHELSHSIEARRRGMPVQSITLFIFGGVSSLGGEPRTARDEFWVAIVGPLTSFVAGLVFFIIWLAARAADIEPVRAVAGYLALINVAVGFFNLLPGFPLDGGRVLRSILWGVKRNMLEATRVAANVGRAIAGLMVVVGLVTAIAGNFGGLWYIFIAMFLWNAAESSYQQLLLQTTFHGVVIGPLVERDVPRIPPDATLREFAHDHVLRRNRRAFFVAAVDAGEIQGLISLSDLAKAPEEEWDRVSVYRTMTPRDRLITVDLRAEALPALQLMAEHNINQLVVLDGREPAGLLSRAALLQAIQLRTQIEKMDGDNR